MASSLLKRVFTRKLTLLNLPLLVGMIGASSCCLSTNKPGGSDGDSKIVGAPHFRFGHFLFY